MTDTITPSSALDAALHRRFCGTVLSMSSGQHYSDGVPIPAYTSSIDAATKLCRKLIPGAVLKTYNEPGYISVEMGSAVGDALLDYAEDDEDRTAILMIGCMLALLAAEEEGRMPHKDGRELHLAIEQARKEEPLFLMHPEARAEMRKAMKKEEA
jgi:hypothetical protein